MATLPLPNFAEFSFDEKMMFERLYAKHGNNWKKIASYFRARTPMDIKVYWVQKTRRENFLREEINLQNARLTARARGTQISISRPSPSPFSWKLVPVEKSIPPTDLEILANVAANLNS